MFKLDSLNEYLWPVKLQIPTNGGKYSIETFDIKFKRLSQERLKEITEKGAKGEIDGNDLCKEVVVGWAGIQDSGADVPFSDTALDKLLDVALVASAIVDAFFESLSGGKRKN